MTRIAFYATIKPPDHPIPSGDRLIARNLLQALELAGMEPFLASSYISYSKREAPEYLVKRKTGALEEAEKIIAQLRDNPPDIWMTYHPYCKAPDWIGSTVTKALDIPYVTVEASKTGQGYENGGDRWKDWRKEAQTHIKAADMHLCLKPTDRAYVSSLLGSEEKLRDLPPFFDATIPDDLLDISLPENWDASTPTLITVGMMRPGKKHKNYKLLARALEPLQKLDWNLVIVGDGPAEEEIRSYFSSFSSKRLHWTGAISPHEVLAHVSAADVFVWPGWKEPIGMVYLESQLMGTPVCALDSMGVSLVVKHNETGLLADECDPDGDVSGFSENLRTIINDPKLRDKLRDRASSYVLEKHSMERAAFDLKNAIGELIAKL